MQRPAGTRSLELLHGLLRTVREKVDSNVHFLSVRCPRIGVARSTSRVGLCEQPGRVLFSLKRVHLKTNYHQFCVTIPSFKPTHDTSELCALDSP
jgi:hypothetical protein